MSRVRKLCALWGLALTLAWSGSATADDEEPTDAPADAPAEQAPVPEKSESKKKADALFDEAFKALDAGDWDSACTKFRQSMRLDISVSTQLNIARCNEHEGKLVQAWADFNRARLLNRETTDDKRREALSAVIDAAVMKLEPRLARVRILVAHPPEGLRIARGSEVLARGAAGEPVPFDPGTHEIVISAPGHLTQRKSVTLKEGQTAEINVELERGEDPTDEPVPIETVAPTQPDQPKAEGTPNWVWVAGGVGILALGGAAVFAAVTASARAELSDNCSDVGGTFQCSSAQYSQDDIDGLVGESNTGLGAAVGLGALGVVGVTVAIIGLAMSGGAADGADGDVAFYLLPSAGPRDAGLVMGGRF